MSAFVVFSMMGFYPVVPGVPRYELGSPVFDRITLRLHNGKTLKLVCRNNSRDNKYIRSVRFNGQPQTRVWFRHADLLHGLTIDLDMSNTPNTTLGADTADLPQSGLTFDPRTLAQ
jgi:putative alpha-1,2-mannosidase